MASACALAMFSGKNIYNFAILENLRIFQNCLFTGGAVTANGICCRWLPAGASRQRGTRSPAGSEPSQALRASSPEGGAKGMMGVLLASPFERLPPVGGRCRIATKRGQGGSA